MSGPAPTRCSELALGQQLIGTAPTTRRWWLVESPGPWGSRPLRDASEGWLRTWSAWDVASARVLLVRPHGRTVSQPRRRIWTFAPGADHVMRCELPWDDEPRIADPGADPDTSEWSISSDHPRVLVCTNGRRDRCCAELGRALLDELPPSVTQKVEGGQVWECTHLGGHRFAPTGLVIPQGFVLGRLTAAALLDLINNDRLDLACFRGRSDLDPAAQVADGVYRIEAGSASVTVRPSIVRRSEARTSTSGGALTMEVHHNGDVRVVSVRQVELPATPASCGADPEPVTVWQRTDL